VSQEHVIAVEGVAMELTSADRRRALPELIFSCVSAALANAGCALRDVDAVTIACEDLIDGRSLSSMITGPAAGAYLRDEIRLSEDGLAALSLAAAQLESGMFDRVLVAAWGRPAESDPELASTRGFDPFTTQPFGLTDLTVSALRASAYLRRYGAFPEEDSASQDPADQSLADRDAAGQESAGQDASDSACAGRVLAGRDRAVRARQERAARNPRANRVPVRVVQAPYPLRPAELRTETDTVAAVVLRRMPAAEAKAKGLARITGVGHGTESYHLGDRLLSGLPSARTATEHALAQAGVDLAAVDVAEVAGRTLWDEVQLLESVRLADPGEGFQALADDARLNPSGGAAAGDCAPATGLVRFAEAVLQLTGQAGGVQLSGRAAPAGTPRVALVVSGAALAGQTHTAVVAQNEP
jgi:acetyl-CoA acetyltransferase